MINQLQVRPRIGLTFANALRCFLRHDPDVILVGEIRDPETAKIAVEASLTGHLLLSTLHTNDAVSAIARLVKLDLEPFLVGSTLVCVCAQRLIRRLCTCKVPVEVGPEELGYVKRAKDRAPIEQLYEPGECPTCLESGHKGRVGVHELMVLSSRLRQAITDNASGEELKSLARKQGMRTLFEDAMEKVKCGTSSLAEALRVCRPDEVI